MSLMRVRETTFPAGDSEYRAARLRCALACRRYNQQDEDATPEQRSKLWQNIISTGSLTPPSEDELREIAAGNSNNNNNNPFVRGSPYVKPPVYIDYGTNLRIGGSTFINRNFTVLDTPICPVRVGERCLIGPNTSIYAVCHPLDYRDRAGPLGAPSLASSVTVEDDCWIGGGVIIMPGVRIGKGCVIGAGSVVTKDVPSGHLAHGNPVRVIRKITESDHALQIPHLLPDSGAVKGDPTLSHHGHLHLSSECPLVLFVSLVLLVLSWVIFSSGTLVAMRATAAV